MNKEIEIQVKIKDPSDVEKKLERVGKFVKTRKQTDKYFVPPQRDFFTKEPPTEYLRIRQEKDGNHLNYSFVHFDDNNQMLSTDEYETFVDNPETIKEIFEKIGLIFKIKVVKTRKYFDCGNFEVTLDHIENLGDFMEVEAKKDFGGAEKTREACLNFLKNLNIEYTLKPLAGYPRMLYRKLNNQEY